MLYNTVNDSYMHAVSQCHTRHGSALLPPPLPQGPCSFPAPGPQVGSVLSPKPLAVRSSLAVPLYPTYERPFCLCPVPPATQPETLHFHPGAVTGAQEALHTNKDCSVSWGDYT